MKKFKNMIKKIEKKYDKKKNVWVQGRFTREDRRAEFDGMDGMGRNIKSVL